MIDFHFVKAYDPCYLYTQSWTFGYKSYLVYGPNFLWYTKMHNVQASVHYLARCIQRADFYFSDDYGLYYSCTQFWTHSSKCYLLHELYFHRYFFFLHMNKLQVIGVPINLQHLDGYCHFMEAYGPYHSYIQSWTYSSKISLRHWPYFQLYICLDIRKCTKCKWLAYYLTRCALRADCHFIEAHGLHWM